MPKRCRTRLERRMYVRKGWSSSSTTRQTRWLTLSGRLFKDVFVVVVPPSRCRVGRLGDDVSLTRDEGSSS